MSKPTFGKNNIIVTGGAGFIGSHLCNELVKKNFIICVDNLAEGSEKNIDHLLGKDNFKFLKHDMNTPLNLEEIKELAELDLRFQGIQEIYHFAALTSPSKFNEQKLEIFNTNIEATRNALELSVKYKAKFIFSSSSVIYGKRPNDHTFFREDYHGYVDPISSRSCYDEGKRCAESLISIYQEKYGINTRIARIFRTYGPKMKLNDGNMIPDFIVSALEGKNLIIYGDKNFSTTLCYVSDIVEGIMKLKEAEDDIGPVNLGNEQIFKLSFIADKIIEIAKEFSPLAKNSKIIYKDALEFMSPLGLPAIAKAKEKLGWIPIVTLEKGLHNMVDYVIANKDLLEMKSE